MTIEEMKAVEKALQEEYGFAISDCIKIKKKVMEILEKKLPKVGSFIICEPKDKNNFVTYKGYFVRRESERFVLSVRSDLLESGDIGFHVNMHSEYTWHYLTLEKDYLYKTADEAIQKMNYAFCSRLEQAIIKIGFNLGREKKE